MVAYSGGLDSHVLLHALVQLRDARDWGVRVVHVHHGLHPQADNWACHCERVCLGLGVDLSVGSVIVDDSEGQGLEAAARRARYDCLATQIGPGETLLTAHHRDDQAETLLLQLLRGAGVHGIAAMPAVSDFSRGRHARPLLAVRRRDLFAYATANNLHWMDDTSNLDTRLGRNFLRHRVLPLMEHHWPAAVDRLAAASEHAADAASLLDEVASDDLRVAESGEGVLSIGALHRLSGPRRRNLLRHWIRKRHGRHPSADALRLLLQHAQEMPKNRRAAFRLGRHEIRRYRDSLYLQSLPIFQPEARTTWVPPARVTIPGSGYCLRAVGSVGSGLSRAALTGRRIEIGYREGGERARLRGNAHRQSLKKLLQESGIPSWRRQRLPLVYVDGVLAAISDRWTGEPFAAAPGEPGWVLVVEPGE